MENQQMPPQGETEEQRDIRENKDIAAFGYVWIMSIVVFAARRDSKFAQYHSKQGIVLFLLSIPVAFIPFIGNVVLLILVAGMLLGFVNAAKGQYRDVPIVGRLSRGEMSLSQLVQEIASAIETAWKAIKHLFSSTKPPSPPPSTPPSEQVTSDQPPPHP